MILFRGELYSDSRQDELIASLKDVVHKPFAEGRRLKADTVIAALDKLARRIMSGEMDDFVRPVLDSLGISDEKFNDMARLFTAEGLRAKCEIELSDNECTVDGTVKREICPLGVLLHIAAGNVDALPAYSVAEGLLAGNVNILKLPMGDSGISVKLLKELIDIEPELKDYIYVFDVPSTETATIALLAEQADGIVVWGGDIAVSAVRKMAPVNAKIIEWGHKLSFAYADPQATDEEMYELALTICETEQLLCSSCQGIFVDTDSREEQEKFAERFFEALKRASGDGRPADYAMRAKNAITLYNEQLEAHFTGNKILSSEGVSVIIKEGSELELSFMYRNVWIKRLPHKDLTALRRSKGYLQTVAVLAPDEEKRNELAGLLALTGVTRITRPGNMNRNIRGGSHDGTYALRVYSKIVETDL